MDTATVLSYIPNIALVCMCIYIYTHIMYVYTYAIHICRQLKQHVPQACLNMMLVIREAHPSDQPQATWRGSWVSADRRSEICSQAYVG